jgi:thioredoxin-related protein
VLVDSGEKMDVVRPYIAGKRVTFPVAVDEQQEATRRYRVYAFPTVIFIDKAGVIQQAKVGAMTEAEFAEALAAIGVTK